MVSVSSFNNTAALTLLKGDTPSSVSSFLNSSVFKVESSEIFGAISDAFSSADMQKQYRESLEFFSERATVGGQRASDDNIRHNAMTEAIIKNRASFPPEEFTVQTDLGEGRWMITTIPSTVSMKGDLFAADMAKKQAAYDETVALQNSEPDAELVKIGAMAQVVKTLVINGQEPDTTLLLNEAERNLGRGYQEEDATGTR